MSEPVPSQIPIQEGLFTWPADEPHLIASRCRDCAEVTFPRQASCPACTGNATEEIPLSRRGRLWTWTVQRFPPPSPPFVGERERFEPFGVGYIELPEGLRVESRLTESDAERLEIGMEMELVIEEFDRDAQGRARMSFAFKPVRE